MGEIRNHYVVKIDLNDICEERGWQVWAGEKKHSCTWKKEGKKKNNGLLCLPRYPVLSLGVETLEGQDGLSHVHCGSTVSFVHAVESSYCWLVGWFVLVLFNLNHLRHCFLLLFKKKRKKKEIFTVHLRRR